MAQREDLALLGADVDLLDRLVAGRVGDREQRRGVLAPALAGPLEAASTEPSPARIAPPRRSGDISVRKASAPLRGIASGNDALVSGSRRRIVERKYGP